MTGSVLEGARESELAGRVVLVTGASGFLGSHLCRRLAAEGARIHGVSRTLRDADDTGVTWWQRDMEDLDAVRGLVAEVKPEVVYHLSGDGNAAPELRLVLSTFHSLLTSTVNLLTAASELGCRRLVLVGSLEEPMGSALEVAPASPYGAAKLGMAAYGRMFHRLFRTPVVILRTYMAYGPGQLEWKVIPSTILALLEGRQPRLSSGERQLDWVYVGDVIDGFLRAGWRPELEGETLDLGSGAAISIRELIQHIVAVVGSAIEPVFGVLPDRPSEAVRVANTERTYAKIGWRPVTPLAEGLRRTVEWLRKRHERGQAHSSSGPPPARETGSPKEVPA